MNTIAELLPALSCPQCKGPLKHAPKEGMVVCAPCRLCFKASDDLVDMRLSAASTVSKKGALVPVSEEAISLKFIEGPILKTPSARMGKRTFPLPNGACVVIVRAREETKGAKGDEGEATIDLSYHLNDHAKLMLDRFMASRRRPGYQSGESGFFGFRRLPDLVVLDAAISKVHCLFFHDDNGLGLLDLFSLNGTHVNGKEVESSALSPGDIVQFGQSAVRVGA